MKHIILTSLLVAAAAFTTSAAERGESRLTREVRHELRELPYYGVFDILQYRVEGNTVILTGAVTRPKLKSDAEKAVRDIEGVEKVDNRVEVLPLSPADDRVRLEAYRTIYGHPALNRYGLNATLPIHIIVRNGNIELIGSVSSELDKTLAGTQVNSIAGGHSVKNNLTVEKD